MTSKRIVKISYFTMLTIIGGLIRVPIPFTPILLTFQTLFVLLCGLMLGCYDGAISQIAYMLLGLLGLPIFTGGGGLWYILQPSFGYIFSFFIAAFVTGVCMRRLKTLSVLKIFLCGAAGLAVIYSIGITYQVMILTFHSKVAFVAAIATVPSVLLMLVKDAVLLYLLCLIYPRLMSMLKIAQKRPIPAIGQLMLPKEDEGGEIEKKEKKKKEEEASAT